MKLDFLHSVRFWALVMLAFGVALNSYGVLPQETMNALITLFGGFIVVRTVDKFSSDTVQNPPSV